uniref:DUF834 domain-containing protein n=1 Tax=Leersia perrieri TaxID=77586 RepID=A0A0D9VLL1_9ORYZ
MAVALPAQRRYEEGSSGSGACGGEDEREEARKQTLVVEDVTQGREGDECGGQAAAEKRGGEVEGEVWWRM